MAARVRRAPHLAQQARFAMMSSKRVLLCRSVYVAAFALSLAGCANLSIGLGIGGSNLGVGVGVGGDGSVSVGVGGGGRVGNVGVGGAVTLPAGKIGDKDPKDKDGKDDRPKKDEPPTDPDAVRRP
jgi:hypothetical protein